MGRSLCAHSGQAYVFFCLRPSRTSFCAPIQDRPISAYSGQASVRPFWASLCAPTLGGPMYERSFWAGLCAPIPGRPLCAHSGQISCAPSLGRPLGAQSGQAFVRPFWAGLCHPIWAGLCAPIWAGVCAPFGQVSEGARGPSDGHPLSRSRARNLGRVTCRCSNSQGLSRSLAERESA